MQLAAGGDLALLAVVDLAADGQRGLPRACLADLAMLVAQAAGAEFKLAGLQRAAAVLRVLLQLDIQRGGALQHAAAVVQLIGAQRQVAVGGQRAGGGVVELAIQLDPAIAGAQRLDAAAAVVQAGGVQLQAVALHYPLLVIQRALQGQRQRLAAGQRAALVVQILPHSKGLRALAAQRALAVV
nr:hypothetical protein [Chromobacterium vaccinii]